MCHKEIIQEENIIERSLPSGGADMSAASYTYDSRAKRTLVRGTVLLLLGSILAILIVSPLEPIEYLYFVLSSDLNVAPMVFLMISDVLLLVAGYLLATSLDSFLSVGRTISKHLDHTYLRLGWLDSRLNRRGLPAIIAAAGVIVIWHVPFILNTALLDFWLHEAMHVTIFFAGALAYVGLRRLTFGMRVLTYLLGCKAMAILGAYLIISPTVVYGTYTYPEQLEAGVAMIAMCAASDATIIPLSLRRFFSKT
jgi:cytochrome c oxidase assembly factor CtaG